MSTQASVANKELDGEHGAPAHIGHLHATLSLPFTSPSHIHLPACVTVRQRARIHTERVPWQLSASAALWQSYAQSEGMGLGWRHS